MTHTQCCVLNTYFKTRHNGSDEKKETIETKWDTNYEYKVKVAQNVLKKFFHFVRMCESCALFHFHVYYSESSIAFLSYRS